MKKVNYLKLIKMVRETIKEYNMSFVSKEFIKIYKECYNEYKSYEKFIFYSNLDREIIKYNLKKREQLHKAS